MTMKKIILILAISTLILSCTTGSESKNNLASNQSTTATNPLSGLWKLSNISGGIAGVNQNFNSTDFTLNFDTTTKTVAVVSNISNPNLSLSTGTYAYTTEIVSGQSIIIINGNYRKRIAINVNLLLDDNVLDDGFFYKYVR